MKILAVCFLLIFCVGHRHRHHTHVAKPHPQTCEQITKGSDSRGNQDDWVSEFPVDQQHRVLECLEKKKVRR